ncbi:MAG: lipid-binding protein [Flavobacteriaceae bacterium]|nr:lipid-binding protein [Flavobacteriaceae bacterium]|tara:strand:+ start:14810 stop:15475 length:666 start_codon:yes stop_codon:yes gene_type:complete
MKRIVLNTFVGLALLAGISCNDNAKKNAEVSEEKEVAEKSESATTYRVDTKKSMINWKGKKPTGTHTGTVNLKSGELAVVDRTIESGSFVMDMNSITVTDLEGDMKANLEAHLKGTDEEKKEDFFNVGVYPTAMFELTGVSGENGDVTVSGNLTIKDVTQNIEFPATVSFPGDEVFLKSDPFMIDRTNWNINFKSKSAFDNLQDNFINDDIELVIELHASK